MLAIIPITFLALFVNRAHRLVKRKGNLNPPRPNIARDLIHQDEDQEE
jgi:hypothetical protein